MRATLRADIPSFDQQYTERQTMPHLGPACTHVPMSRPREPAGEQSQFEPKGPPQPRCEGTATPTPADAPPPLPSVASIAASLGPSAFCTRLQVGQRIPYGVVLLE